MSRLPLLLTALALLFPATAAAKVCPSQSVYELNKVTNVSCSKAKKVIAEFFKNGSPALGFACKTKPYEGGATTTCVKGDKRIKHFSAD